MRLALLGTGAMGRLVAERAAQIGHEIALRVGGRDRPEHPVLIDRLRGVDAAVDFSVADAVVANVAAAVAANVPIVVGTTGWLERLPQIKHIVESGGAAMVYGANFSIGVNLFYRIVENAAKLLSAAGGYEAFIEEQHHSRKKDAPSGTALKLKSLVSTAMKTDPSVAATRAGHITGTHRVGFDGEVDQVLLTHAAKNRNGFADGAILAAQWIIGKRGVFEFDAVLDSIMK